MNKSYRIGSLEVTEWESEKGNTYSIRKSYKDKTTNEWKESKYLYRDDLLVLQAVITRVLNDQCVIREIASKGGFEKPSKEDHAYRDQVEQNPW